LAPVWNDGADAGNQAAVKACEGDKAVSDDKCSGGGSSVGCGCLPIILTIIALWALVFGVTWNGRKYDIGCSCSRGVVIE
jgi:hypothetical protein